MKKEMGSSRLRFFWCWISPCTVHCSPIIPSHPPTNMLEGILYLSFIPPLILFLSVFTYIRRKHPFIRCRVASLLLLEDGFHFFSFLIYSLCILISSTPAPHAQLTFSAIERVHSFSNPYKSGPWASYLTAAWVGKRIKVRVKKLVKLKCMAEIDELKQLERQDQD